MIKPTRKKLNLTNIPTKKNLCQNESFYLYTANTLNSLGNFYRFKKTQTEETKFNFYDGFSIETINIVNLLGKI